MKSISVFTTLMLILALTCAFSASAQAGEALELMKKKEGVVRQIISVKTVKGTPEHTAKENKLRVEINTLFDFEELGRRALAEHWAGKNPMELQDFLVTLQSLIEKNYLLKAASKASYEVMWFPEVNEADCTIVRHKLKSGDYFAKIQYKMIKKNNRWVVFDMVIDDVSLLENYKSQFKRNILKKGFPKLNEKMKKKLVDSPTNNNKDVDDDSDNQKPMGMK